AGLPLWRRAVYTACRAGFERLVIVTGAPEELRSGLEGDHHLEGRRSEIAGVGGGWPKTVRELRGRWVVLGEEWVVDDELLVRLAATSGASAAADREGPFAADAAEIARWSESGWQPDAPAVAVGAICEKPLLHLRVSSEADARRAEDVLFQGLARNVNNFFARYVDRAMSRAISRRLAPYPVTPNQITIFSILLGIAGALILLDPSYLAGAIGAFLFFAHTVIDGCDGEIARLKFQESASGAKLDLIGDNVVHAFLFPCMAARFYFADPSGPFLVLGAVVLAGVLVTWVAVYVMIVRSDPSPTVRRCFETFANREFAYLVLVLGLVGKLDWFVWAMAFGLWIFPSALVIGFVWDRGRA
ncbi:MAG: CDP-alcohol phosphatidyltransferase family protein, partial [Candidatus Binatia bacterium]